MTPKEERALIKSVLAKPLRAVPGSVHVATDGLITWTERCGARCRHLHGECWAARSALAPSLAYEERT